jgi:putative tryptophan/tyrosine transport system substrate-binding protein
MADGIRRREFIVAFGSASLTLPLPARAQQPEPMRRIGVLMPLAADDLEAQARITAFVQGLQQLGWNDGHNVRIDIRWAAENADDTRKYAAELVALTPDVILATGSATVAALQQATRTVPIVFVQIADPVGSGLVESLARPGGNATGFTLFEYGLSGKWLELLKEIAPRVTRAGVLRDASIPGGTGQLGAIQSVASSLGVELRPIDVRDAGAIERAVTAFAHGSNGGLIVTASVLANVHRDLLITLAALHRLPAVYSDRVFVTGGGLISYGPYRVDQYRRAADYVDRILKGEKPADLPVQAPTKYELVINLKTAKALDLIVPPTLLTTADEVIE